MIMNVNGVKVEVYQVTSNIAVNKDVYPDWGFYWCSYGDSLPDINTVTGPFLNELQAQQDALNAHKMKEAA